MDDETSFEYERPRQQRLQNIALARYRQFLGRSALWVVVPIFILMLAAHWIFSIGGEGFAVLAVVCFALTCAGMSGLAVYIYQDVDNAVASETPLMGYLIATACIPGLSAVGFGYFLLS